MMKKATSLMALAVLSGSLLLAGCETTPDESYKKSQMERPLDYPPDLVAPTLEERFEVPAAAEGAAEDK